MIGLFPLFIFVAIHTARFWQCNLKVLQITRDDSDGYSCMSTHQVKPVEWALNKMKDKCQDRLEYNINYDYSKYKLVIN